MGWLEKSVFNVLDVLPGWHCRASCTMVGLSGMRHFQPEALCRMGNARPLWLGSVQGYMDGVSMQTPLQIPILVLLSQEVLLSCSK